MNIKKIAAGLLMAASISLVGCGDDSQSTELPETADAILAPYKGKDKSEGFLMDKCMAGYREAFPGNTFMHVEDRWEKECYEVAEGMAVMEIGDTIGGSNSSMRIGDAMDVEDASSQMTAGEEIIFNRCVHRKTFEEDPQRNGIPKQVEYLLAEECAAEINMARTESPLVQVGVGSVYMQLSLRHVTFIEVQARSNYVILEGITVNRGNCQIGDNNVSSVFPISLKFGETKKIGVPRCSVKDVIEVVVHTNVGDIEFNF